MMRIDVHQHLWTEPLVEALSRRRKFPFIRHESGLAVLHLADERPYVIELSGEDPSARAALVHSDCLDQALVCLSSPLGIEWLPREQARALLEHYHRGALALGEPFGVWGAIALEHPESDDVNAVLAEGCVGVSLPAGALASVEAIGRLGGVLARLEGLGAPLLVHPGPSSRAGARSTPGALSLYEPLWWPALTGYVAGMQAAWLAFLTAGRSSHPELRIIFSMLAGLAPLQIERLASRGVPTGGVPDPLTFYDTSSYGPSTVRMLQTVVGDGQLLYGSDRPIVEPARTGMPDSLDWAAVADGTCRALGAGRQAVSL
ncbi:MAG TPA: hypothetical protein VKG62_00445 [Solirubrobacteraceae bacterium]|nr:hypothetical protein [Solirubrobacteraceae bacterium]